MQVLSFREFEGVSRLSNSCVRFQITSLFIEKRFGSLKQSESRDHMLWSCDLILN